MTFTKEQEKAFEKLTSGKNVFLTGDAGTGKSFVLNKYIEYCKEHKINIMVTAPTGIAAINIGGATLHRVFRAPLHPIVNTAGKSISDALDKADVVIIDEVSMCRADLFSYVINCIKRAEDECFIHKQIVVCGDFFQLPPVCTDKDIELLPYLKNKPFAFQTDEWGECEFEVALLTEIVRQEGADFARNLNLARCGVFEGVDWIRKKAAKNVIKGGIVLAPTNRQVAEINAREVERLDGKSVMFYADVTGDVAPSERFTDDVLEFKDNMRVMAVINDVIGGYYQNGSLGTVIGINDNCVEVAFDNGNVCEIGMYETEICDYTLNGSGENVVSHKVGSFRQIPLKVAYATTIHKSQGKTYDSVNLYANCFAEGQLYVALSRVTDISGLHFMGAVGEKNLKTSRAVIDFYNSFVGAEGKIKTPTIGEKKGKAKTAVDSKEKAVMVSVPKHLKKDVEDYIKFKIAVESRISERWVEVDE